MLDKETKRKIDTLRDILVGKIPDPTVQVDQITTALIYKFMDDMDQEAKSAGGLPSFFTGEFKKFRWPKLLDKKLSGAERMDLYIQALSLLPQNKKLPALFREIFKNAFLPYRSAETLNLFLKQINEFSYHHSESLGNAFEYLLSILGSQGEAGQFRTPRHIIDFMVAVLDPKKDESLLDPACGTAGFLISSYKHIIKNNSQNYNPDKEGYSLVHSEDCSCCPDTKNTGLLNKKIYKGDKLKPADKRLLQKNIIGYDISPKMVKLSLVNMYLHQFKNPQIYEYDSLTSTDRWDEDFNVILANPPFMTPKGGIRPHNKFSIQANRSEVLFVDYIAEHLTLNGRAGIIVPEGIIFKNDKAYKALRKRLVEEHFLWAVLSLPAKVFEPYSGVKTSILFLDKKRAKKLDEILFVDVQNDGFELGATRRKIDKNDLPEAFKILKIYSKGKKKKTQIAHWVSKKIIKTGDYNLTGNRYKETQKRPSQWPMVELGDVCEIFSGARAKGGAVTKGVLSIGGEHINRDGSFNLSKPKYIPEDFFKKLKKGSLQNNDVLIVKDGATTGKMGYFDEKSPFTIGAVNEHVFILRSKTNKIEPYYLYQILRSKEGHKQILKFKTGSAQGGINLSIKKIKIPLPPLKMQKKIVDKIQEEQDIIQANKRLIEINQIKIQQKILEVWGQK